MYIAIESHVKRRWIPVEYHVKRRCTTVESHIKRRYSIEKNGTSHWVLQKYVLECILRADTWVPKRKVQKDVHCNWCIAVESHVKRRCIAVESRVKRWYSIEKYCTTYRFSRRITTSQLQNREFFTYLHGKPRNTYIYPMKECQNVSNTSRHRK